jgi:hypothetical protein
MLTDLSKDWASGPPSDYQRWIPMIYVVQLDMHRFEINQYANDHNIIDKPLTKEENGKLYLFYTHGIVIIPCSYDHTSWAAPSE